MTLASYAIYVNIGFEGALKKRKEIRYNLYGRFLIAPAHGLVREVSAEEFLKLESGEEAFIETDTQHKTTVIRL